MPSMTNLRVHEIVDEIIELYRSYGTADYIGEPVSQLEHMSQSAMLAIAHGADCELILSAFFHDIGHLCHDAPEQQRMNGYGIREHEQIGAAFLRERGFSDRVVVPIENHVKAKRYLTFRHPSYFDGLSEASKYTLSLQGGPMGVQEAEEFEKELLFEESILVRRWDDDAKKINQPVIDLEIIRIITRAVLEQRLSSS
jgi:phosphonate degradation associated HDIG domain protein